ncbi:magnesium and cobalt transport protein CorA [Acinetobacter sp. ANC 5380]|uniref:Magnesium and cobalt transport protein CorA n=1 Tax=Acinetobacter terrae TaxID=2731247 RepID=A0A4R0EQK1_9GAMM|nr:CorA family divalent cation transporter [Acinetobacter terrae]NNH15980.1 magnesium and cobalt transport protein CorA [Acinetobacter terrae]NNH37813.1 magnesium and cobalt transport protein CorA [Acinetobacter terrae]NNH78910.1 magnesium and cobalt transport protein CorA [Acinetobacter terrae]NNH86830.1 magnesium and cobalt transport protein CorA [Acinetobacter terrae]TCB61511.1 magnesium and cobalt transport protein CorA [Acinetobacter terrae]
MLEAFYATERGSLEDATINGGFDLHQDLVWIDLIAPSQEEQQWVLDAYEQNLPTLKSLEDISSSARFYRDDDGILHISTYFLTKNKNFQVDGETDDDSSILATVQTVAFILHKQHLFTLRGEKLVAFRAFRARARRNDYEIDYKDPTWVLLGLLEAKLDELADILEDVHKDLEKYSTEVLNNRHREQILDLDDMITRLAQLEDMLGKAQLCLIDLRRVLTFLSRPRALGSHIYDADIRELSEDVRSLVEHDAFLFQKVRFLLDTTSGFINTEQNDTIRRFSILPSMLAPPMLVASVYGMNTDVLPFARGTSSFIMVGIILVAFFIGPLIYFRWKKWI